MTQLGLIRHGHTDWNRQGKIQGHTDIPLDSQAMSELEKLTLPADWSEAKVVSSPLKRAVQTATILAQPPKQEPALIEMNWGDWEGEKGAKLAADPTSGYHPIEDWGWDYRPPGGESPAEVWERLKPWLLRLEGKVLAVCHIGIMRVLLARAHRWDFSGPAPFSVKRNRIFVLDVQVGEPCLTENPIVPLKVSTG